MNENKQLLVSVAIITYNHAPFIRQALDSVLVQQTDFIFEIVIGEDRSMDGTREIVEDYWKKYPDRINIVTAENNVGANRNVIRTLKACKGKYIALLEGDDYWSDPMKLQKQIDFFEANPNYGLCFTDCILVDSQNKLIKNGRVPEEIKNKKLDYFDLLYYTPPTLTTMFRNSKLIIDEVEKTGKAYDHILFYIASKKKEVHFISTIAGVHRLNSSSIYNPLTSVNKILDFSIPNLRVLEKLTERGDKNEKIYTNGD